MANLIFGLFYSYINSKTYLQSNSKNMFMLIFNLKPPHGPRVPPKLRVFGNIRFGFFVLYTPSLKLKSKNI